MKTFLAAALLLLAPVVVRAEDRNEITIANVIAEMNIYRAEKGLPPLAEEPRLAKSAQDRMHEMEDLGYWAHVAPDGHSPFVWIRANGYQYSSVGENLAAGFETVKVLVEGWMESPGHRANILSPIYTDCGVAIIDGGTTGQQTGKSIVVMFGRQQSVPQRAAK